MLIAQLAATNAGGKCRPHRAYEVVPRSIETLPASSAEGLPAK